MKRLRVGSMAVGIACIVIGMCAGAATTEPATVKIENFSFEPKELTIAVGTTVTWVNEDDVPHTATGEGESPAFDSKALDTDDKFSFTFTKAGVYPYYCKVHPHMKGTIVVK
jgi:plastocyanin